MKRVFVVNEPLKRQYGGEFGRAINLKPAEEYGELVFLSDAGEPPADPVSWLPRMAALLSTFKPEDYLLPVGHPTLIVAAACLLGRYGAGNLMGAAIDRGNGKPIIRDNLFGSVNVLRWCGGHIGYRPTALPLFNINSQSLEKTNAD